jgi:hypothetical protein
MTHRFEKNTTRIRQVGDIVYNLAFIKKQIEGASTNSSLGVHTFSKREEIDKSIVYSKKTYYKENRAVLDSIGCDLIVESIDRFGVYDDARSKIKYFMPGYRIDFGCYDSFRILHFSSVRECGDELTIDVEKSWEFSSGVSKDELLSILVAIRRDISLGNLEI